ncbi:MAG: peptide ABC transporter permease [Candidatus Rokubacteria bacterium RIFCSPLOWO2_02_FULL_68_19]|nr:MAG: peptide ABC transporter permease [Candidatus Rokubacteria bacterium RIFCSPLOWO2_02_FULL_68_19]
MLTHLLRRVAYLIPTLLLISAVVFILLRLMPGDPAVVLAGQDASPEIVADIRARFGLDQPILVQYVLYLKNVLAGDLGRSIRSKQPVAEEVASRLPATLLLGFTSIGLAFIAGLGLGVAAAVREGRWLDVLLLIVALLGVSAPTFWLGLLLMLVFAVHLAVLPVAGSDGWNHLILPAATLMPNSLAVFARLSRSTLLEVLGEDFIRTAIAKGAKRTDVLWRHAMRNALIPPVTFAGLEFGRLLGGIIAVETIFAWPGAGKALVDAIATRDFPMIQGIVLTFALLFAVLNLLVDVLNGLIDPRVRYA